MEPGDPIDETGLLLRDGSAFHLRRDLGGDYLLTLARTPVDEVQKRVRVIGTYVGESVVEAEGVRMV